MSDETVEEIGAAELVEDVVESTDTLTEIEVEVVEESADDVAEVVDDLIEIVTEETEAVAEVIEEMAEQGLPGAPGDAMAEEVVRVIATEEVEETRVDYDALVAATLFQ